jgi:hypothetical protein
MTNQHPITPPPELVQQWINEEDGLTAEHIATQAARWGADQELEACLDVLGGQWEWDLLSQCTGWKEFRDQSEEILRAARRPKPPTLKEQALHAANLLFDHSEIGECALAQATIRRALETLSSD